MDCFTFAASLKACANKKDLCGGRRLHVEILRMGFLQKSPYLGSSLISMYAKCGMLEIAQEVLDALPFRNRFSWNALIAGYAQQGNGFDALNCFQRMQNECLFPDAITYTCVVKASGIVGATSKCKQIHDEISRSGLLANDVVLGSALVDMYVKCGMVTKAEEVLKELPIRNVVSWNALITGYAQQGQGDKALECLKQMQIDGLCPDEVTFISICKACCSIGCIEIGKRIHEEIVVRGLLEKDIVLSSALVDMYAKCGLLAQARQVLEGVSGRSISSWNAVISGHVQREQHYEALECFELMQCKGHTPDVVTLTCVLKACGRIRAVDKGEQIHKQIVSRSLLQKDCVLCNTLVDMYAKCGELTKAEKVLEEIPIRDVVAWNTLISGYAQHGKGYEALNCFELMKSEGLSPDTVTFICVLSACSDAGAIDKGKQIHDDIARRGLLLKDIALGNALIDMYAKYGAFATAEEVMKDLPVRDAASWNSLISGYTEHGLCREALQSFERMKCDGISPDKITFICILKACASMEAIEKGKQIHDEVVDSCLLEDTMLGTALVDMYAKCGLLAKAQKVLEELSVRNLTAWSALISGYAQRGKIDEALHCLERMQSEGFYPDAVTFMCLLKACGRAKAIDKGKRIHDHIARMQLLDEDIVLSNALLDMYVKCGMLHKAHRLLRELHVRDDISWNTLIVGYAQSGQCHEALTCFEEMQADGLSPSFVTFICILNICGNTGAIDKGKQIHEEVQNRGLLKVDIVLGNALVDMYVKCGMLAKARQVLDELPTRDVISWSVLIAGYAQQGQGHEALICLKDMLSEGISPDTVTLLCVLSSCSRSGLWNEAQILFGSMNTEFGISPNLAHHICLVVAYGGAGLFDKAMAVIKAMPSSDSPDVWLALLGCCKNWGKLELGSHAFEEAVRAENGCGGAASILMAKMFAAAGMHEDAERLNAMRLKLKEHTISVCIDPKQRY
jgi:pentatricopeptide repeat protein